MKNEISWNALKNGDILGSVGKINFILKIYSRDSFTAPFGYHVKISIEEIETQIYGLERDDLGSFTSESGAKEACDEYVSRLINEKIIRLEKNLQGQLESLWFLKKSLGMKTIKPKPKYFANIKYYKNKGFGFYAAGTKGYPNDFYSTVERCIREAEKAGYLFAEAHISREK